MPKYLMQIPQCADKSDYGYIKGPHGFTLVCGGDHSHISIARGYPQSNSKAGVILP